MASNEAGMAANAEQRDMELSGALASRQQSIPKRRTWYENASTHWSQDAPSTLSLLLAFLAQQFLEGLEAGARFAQDAAQADDGWLCLANAV